MAIDVTLLQALLTHLTLPPRIREDLDVADRVLAPELTKLAIASFRRLQKLTDGDFDTEYDNVCMNLSASLSLQGDSGYDEAALLQQFATIRNATSIAFLIVHVPAQNAALLIWKAADKFPNRVIFEAFEASPKSDAVLTSDCLQMDFPGSSVSLELDEFSKPCFQKNLASFLCRAATEIIPQFAEKVYKAGVEIVETRGTCDPSLISSMLMIMLYQFGQSMGDELPLIRKRVHDDCVWTRGGTTKPWRRIPDYLILRVALRGLLWLHFGDSGLVHVKYVVALMLATLLPQTVGKVEVEQAAYLKNKLARRVAKLAAETSAASRRTGAQLMKAAEPIFEGVLKNTVDRIANAWEVWKAKHRKHVELFRSRRAPLITQELKLFNSWSRMQFILDAFAQPSLQPSYRNVRISQSESKGWVSTFRQLTDTYRDQFDQDLCFRAELLQCSQQVPERACIDTSSKIKAYVALLLDHKYGKEHAEALSLSLLTLLELWVELDKAAVQLYTLMEEYHPGLPDGIMDVFQLRSWEDLSRVQRVHTYLRNRTQRSHRVLSVFDKISPNAYAVCAFDKMERMQELMRKIENDAVQRESEKMEEWKILNAKYENLKAQEAAQPNHTTRLQEDWPFDLIHDDDSCEKCKLEGRIRRLWIKVCEHPLPDDDPQAKAVVFELCAEEAFCEYRDATFAILSRIAHHSYSTESQEPLLLLRQYEGLKKELVDYESRSFGLASKAKKSFHQTHYWKYQLPVDTDKLFVPCAVSYAYYDEEAKVYAAEVSRVSLNHHFTLDVPIQSPLAQVLAPQEYHPGSGGPTSNQIISSQSQCPRSLNIHEFLSVKMLHNGTSRRFYALLQELGSSNINFAADGTIPMLNRLIHELATAGPVDEDPSPLRLAFGPFKHRSFCDQLLAQIEDRMSTVLMNFREHNSMEVVLMLLSRLFCLTDEDVALKARKLILSAREATASWMCMLRQEIFSAKDASSLAMNLEHALWAALLCRRTFEISLPSNSKSLAPPPGMQITLDQNELTTFLTSSLVIQDSMRHATGSVTPRVRNALISDVRLCHSMRSTICNSLTAHPESLLASLETVWPTAGEQSRECVLQRLPRDLAREPVTARVRTAERLHQTLEFNVFDGQVLLDHQPIGRLPECYGSSELLQELVGNQSLYSFASDLPGMAHVLHVSPRGHQIHVGTLHGTVVIRICISGEIYEVLDRKIFYGNGGFDLPHALIEDCVHFLHLKSKVVQCRRKTSPWVFNPTYWRIDLQTRKGWKGQPESPIHLVDVYSFYFGIVSAFFRDFEKREHLIVQQATNYPCAVELPRSEMTWIVGKRRLLYCKQLGAEIDPNQDAGTLYGLDSAIVVRNEMNHSKRSILVPLGNLNVQRSSDNLHVSVKVSGGTGAYVCFDVDHVLGRLSCAADSRVLCYLARLHALTSFVVPDILTGHTGTEEALALLHGPCQPSAPLHPDAVATLQKIAALTPPRSWYPPDQRSLQMVAWDKEVSSIIQHTGYLRMVQDIFERSNALAPFYGETRVYLHHASSPDLDLRATTHRSRFLRFDPATTALSRREDAIYRTRHIPNNCSEHLGRVMEALSRWPERLHSTAMLSELLESNAFSMIGGFAEEYEPPRSIHSAMTADFAAQFGPVAQFCKKRSREDTWTLAFALAPFAYRDHANFDVLEIWLAYTMFDELKAIDTPQWPSYAWFHREQHPTADTVVAWLQNAVLVRDENERIALRSALNRKQLHYGLQISEDKRIAAIESELQNFARHLVAQWPTNEPRIDGFVAQYLNLHSAMKSVTPEFQRLYRNLDLSRHIAAIQGILDRRRIALTAFNLILRPSQNVVLWTASNSVAPQLQAHLLAHGFDGALGRIDVGSEVLRQTATSARTKQRLTAKRVVTGEMHELQCLLSSISDQASAIQTKYFDDLKQSLAALQAKPLEHRMNNQYIDVATAEQRVLSSQANVRQRLGGLHSTMYRCLPTSKWLRYGDIWPSMSKVDLVQCLQPTANISFGKGMKKALLELAIALSCYQHALRVQDAVMQNDRKKLTMELDDGAHQAYSAERYPEWLLLELEANIHIRPDQVEVALASIHPSSGTNSVLQMNMGLGKTSVIMPAIAAHLAGQRKHVMRVIVPRSLLSQTSTLLHQRLGRLLGSNVLHIPYSRQTDHSVDMTKVFLRIHKHAQKSGSVVLATPEHILSFKLCGLQTLSDGSIEIGRQLVHASIWLAAHSRDLLDESDHILSPKSGLTFPSGNMSAPDGAPFRWTVSQAVLTVVEMEIPALQAEFPNSIEVVPRAGGYPTIYFLRRDVEDELIVRVRKSLTSGHGSVLDLRGLSRAERRMIDHFLSDPIVPRSDVKELAYMFREDPDQTKRLLLLRGLLVQRILMTALKKRYNVQYGIDQRRAPLAVPFIAKGTPTELSEFGHPDVAILLTILAFYYAGLSFQQLRQSLVNIAKTDDPNRVYDSFIQGTRVPDSLREFDNLNEDDSFQLSTLWEHIKYSTTVINYYLNTFVFPRHAKQFSVKLQANAFDLPLTTPDLKAAGARSTGFSGTNDVRNLLPSTCPQNELPSLQHTNAMVITYLLAQRNRRYEVAWNEGTGRRSTELDLLCRLKALKIRTLIDAGAMILELSNLDVVKAWLEIDQEASAALYFNSNHEAMIRYRQGREIPLLISNISDLSEILVYIDESHIRGTDLSLPDACFGALTLGLSLTKDALMQAAMRLRKLGSTQRVMFFAPLEVHQAILDSRPEPRNAFVDSSHVLRWNLLSTAANLEALIPLHWSNGANFVKRSQAAWDNWNFLYDKDHEAEFLHKIQEKEKLTLHRLYQPRHGTKLDTELKDYITAPPLQELLRNLSKLRRKFQDAGSAVNASVLEELEQEAQREVEVEVEVEAIRERQLPPRYHPETYHGLNAEIKAFIQSGQLSTSRGVCEHAFAALRRSAIGRKYCIRDSATMSCFYASYEFSRTVAFPQDRPNDSMLRAAHALLYFPGSESLPETALLISQEEMDDCLNWIRQLRAPAAHLLLYSAPVTKKMLQFNNLNYCAIPALDFKAPMWLKIELGIFAGRLYFECEEYEAIKAFLGISDEEESTEDLDDDSLELSKLDTTNNDRLLALEKRKARLEKVFTSRPIAFMNEYLAALRKDTDMSATPMAFVLSGKRLPPDHPLFAPRKAADVQKKLSTMRQEIRELEKDEEVVHVDGLHLALAGEELHADELDGADDDEVVFGVRSEASQDTEDESKSGGEEHITSLW